MRIRINDEQFKIKSSTSLTVKEFFRIITAESRGNVMSYINAVTNSTYIDISEIVLKNKEIGIINSFIGEIKTFEYFLKKCKPQKDFVFMDQIINLKKLNPLTLAARQAYTDFIKDNDKNIFEASLFIFAIIINRELNKDYDVESTKLIYNELQDLNYINVFENSVFFLKKLMNG